MQSGYNVAAKPLRFLAYRRIYLMKKLLALSISLPALAVIMPAQAEGTWGDDLAKAVRDGKASLDFRYRYEYVDQDSFDDEAEASLMRSRLTLESADLKGFKALIEADNVTNIGVNDYNSTENGKTEYPVVADPEGTEINQIWLKYKMESFTGTGGRQRINLGNQRFVGGVAWRQNEQTYDGGRIEWAPLEGLSIDASYVYNINRIWGPDDGDNPADLEGDNFFLRADYALTENHKLAAFGYFLDIDDQGRFAAGKTVNNSSDTYGLEYSGKIDRFSLRASWATQSEAGDSELSYDADYYAVELGAKFELFDLKVGYEMLEGDEGVGFATPLATLHKFQGWADKFLTTPGDGIEDAWASVGGKLGPVKLAAIYHDFQAESSSTDFGTEIDLVATWAVNKQFTLQAKYASFDTDDSSRYDDTDKAWLTLQLKL
jgi:hypothetical protein